MQADAHLGLLPKVRTRMREHLQTYSLILMARALDSAEAALARQGTASFQVSGTGHEASAALAIHLEPHDWLHLHYRDKALAIARGVSAVDFVRALLGRMNGQSAGRQMPAHFAEPAGNVLSVVGPVGNNALQAVGVAAAVRDRPGAPVVVCAIGDGGTQQGEFMEAVAEAVRLALPVLFLIHDNGFAISTSTVGKTFFELPDGPAAEFLGVPITRIDGTDVLASDAGFGDLVAGARFDRRPRIAVMACERLCDHTNADDQSRYRSPSELEFGRRRDPLASLASWLLQNGVTERELAQKRAEIAAEIDSAVATVLAEPDPGPAREQDNRKLEGAALARGDGPIPATMREAINAALRRLLLDDERVFLYGQDIEDPKGDVFGVTRGLSIEFPGRVANAPLSESTILGTAIGRALAGQRPIAFLQFADFLPLAFNQFATELGSMEWRTNGGFRAPVLVLAPCGGYKAGLGPFHSQTWESIACHVPGVDVVMPANAHDAYEMLVAAYRSERPTLFLYPKGLLNVPNRTTDSEPRVPSLSRLVRSGDALTMVAWGHTVSIAETAADWLATAGDKVDLIDLRSLSPWDEGAVLASVERTGRLVVVHEDNRTCGFGAEVAATVAERSQRSVSIRRVTRPDTYVPFRFASQLAILPSARGVLEACAELLNLNVDWPIPERLADGDMAVRARGSGPADDSATVRTVYVTVGQRVETGTPVAELEATKANVVVEAPCFGVVTEVSVCAGDQVPIGTPLARLKPDVTSASIDETPVVPKLRAKRTNLVRTMQRPESSKRPNFALSLTRPEVAHGTSVVETSVLAARMNGWTTHAAVSRTGINRRRWVGEGETAVTLALRSSRRLAERLPHDAPKIAAVICSTTRPTVASPSIASQVATSWPRQNLLSTNFAAFDLNAACSGYLYALRIAADLLAGRPGEAALVVTAEALSPGLDPQDPQTVFLFGDGATTTLATAGNSHGRRLRLSAPTLRAARDAEDCLNAPCNGADGYLRMDGMGTARAALREMSGTMKGLAESCGVPLTALEALVPHPGSKYILKLLAQELEIGPEKIWHTLEDTGNTSSSSIPLALNRHWERLPTSVPIGLVSFGAGFTAAAAIGEMTAD